MKSRMTCAFGAAAVLLAGAVIAPAAAIAAPSQDAGQPASASSAPARADDRPDPLATKQREAKAEAAQAVATGDAKVVTRGKGAKASKVVQIAPGKYVEYGTQETARLLTFLVEFGDGDGGLNTTAPAGPEHNSIPEPGADDNTTYWEDDFSSEHFKEMFFTGLADQGGESFRGIYDEMSSGRFDLEGDVSDWVTVPHREAYYGDGDDPADADTLLDGSETQAGMTAFIQDSANAWYADQIAQGKTKDEVTAYLESFDIWDRYDIDGDGIINEPDGYIDHFQAIHAGTGEEAGAEPWTIWSHRWAANQAGLGTEGPADFPKVGGVKIGDTDLWIRDYTTEPENGGLGVFAHEFGHDLGLPDYYDTTNTAENGTGFWNLMSAGSWMGHGTGTIGTTPNHMGATEKLFLGWLDYTTVEPGASATVNLGPSFHASTQGAQAVVVDLPESTETFTLAAPQDGKYVHSDSRNNLNTSITSPAFTVPAGASVTAKVNYGIEVDYDYAYVEVSTDGGASWTALATNLSAEPGSGNTGGGITGDSGGAWVDLSADLSAYAGQSANLRFRYTSDGGVNEFGLALDDVAVGSALVEDFDDLSGWTNAGFVEISADGTYQKVKNHFYVAENRVYGGYDATLATGPYNWSEGLTRPDWVEQFPYQDGLLVWYVNSLWGDNNVADHPGRGEALPVDARPTALRWSNGTIARNKIQTFDSTFGVQPTDAFTLHSETTTGLTTLTLAKRPAVPVFDDTDPARYYDQANPTGSVLVGGTGTTITVVKQNAKKGTMQIKVN